MVTPLDYISQFQKLGVVYLEHIVVQDCSLVLIWVGSYSLLTDLTALVLLIITLVISS